MIVIHQNTKLNPNNQKMETHHAASLLRRLEQTEDILEKDSKLCSLMESNSVHNELISDVNITITESWRTTWPSHCSASDGDLSHQTRHRKESPMVTRRGGLLSTHGYEVNGKTSELAAPLLTKKKRNLHQIFKDLDIELDTAPRYRTRNFKRRHALSTTNHPYFEPCSRHQPLVETSGPIILQGEETVSSETAFHGVQEVSPRVNEASVLEQHEDARDAGRKRRRSRLLSLSMFKSSEISSQNKVASTTEPINHQGLRRSISLFAMQQTTEPIKQSLRRSSSLLTKQVIAIFKNETFEEIDESQIQQHRHNNVLLETLVQKESQNILNVIKGNKRPNENN